MRLANRVAVSPDVASSAWMVAGDVGHGFEQAVEGAEQAEKDQQAGEIARGVLGFIEPVADRIEDRAHRGRGDHRLAEPVAQQVGDRAQGGAAGVGGIVPSCSEFTHLISGNSRMTWRKLRMMPITRASKIRLLMNGLAQKKTHQLGEQDRRHQRHQHQEDHDLDEVNRRAGEVVGVVVLRHVAAYPVQIRVAKPKY